MPTFLANSKMPQALRSRVESSVRGLRRGHGARVYTETRTALLRFGVAGLLVLVAVVVWRERVERAKRITDAKANLLQARAELRTTLTPNAYTLADRIRLALRRESNSYTGAFKSDELSRPEDWEALLRRSAIYARLPTDSANQPDRLESLLSESHPDAFVLCLKQPPEDRTEKTLMRRINAARTETNEVLVNVRPAFDAVVTTQLLAETYDDQVTQANELESVLELQAMWDRARVEERLPAVFAEVLIALLDEPKLPDTPVELDGATVHKVRVFIADLSRDQEKVLFRGSYDMNPNWVSERRRHQYAQALDSCRIAAEVRETSRH
jgi:hypothetical protein